MIQFIKVSLFLTGILMLLSFHSCEVISEASERAELTVEELEGRSMLVANVTLNSMCSIYPAGEYKSSDPAHFYGIISFVDGQIIIKEDDRIMFVEELADGTIKETDANEIVFGSFNSIDVNDYVFTQNDFGSGIMTSLDNAVCDLIITGLLI